MSRTLLAFMLVLSSVASAQVQYPYNPDAEPDGLIGVSDVLEILPQFGSAFTPQEITVNGEGLSTVLEEMQTALDSLSNITGGTTAFGEKVFLDFDSMKWTMGTWEIAVFNPSTDGFFQINTIYGGCDNAPPLHVNVIPESLDPCAGDYGNCNFSTSPFFYSAELAAYQFRPYPSLTIPVRESELIFLGSASPNYCTSADMIWTPLQHLDIQHSSATSCEDIDLDGICDFADACMGMEVSFHYAENPVLQSSLFSEGGEYPQANLTGLDLSGVCAPRVQLDVANLSFTNLSSANISEAILWDAEAVGVVLNQCSLRGADLSNVNASATSAIGADFSNADLYQAQFSNGNCSNSNFQGANLRFTNFISANLSFCDFTDQDFTLTYLEGAQMESAILTGAVMNCLSGGCPSSLPDGYYCEPDPDCIYGANDGHHRILAIE